MSERDFSDTQKQYLAGFVMGADVARAVRGLPILSGAALVGTTQPSPMDSNGSPVSENSVGTSVQVGGTSSPPKATPFALAPEHIAHDAQLHQLAAGKKLCNEEKAKQLKNPLDMWDEIAARAARGEFPKGTEVFLTKWHGLFHVAPAQNSFMCRLRIPGGELRDFQLAGLADLADRSAGGTLDVTTRANLQLREIPADQAVNILYGVRDIGLISLGAGGDNIRNVTASPLSGVDPHELVETLPIAKRMHHYIATHREMYGLPRKFNIAYDGGGRISALDDTNDIGFRAIRITEQESSAELEAGVYFQLTLGGITGHGDFASPTDILLTANETLAVAGAIVRVFVKHGDRTDRKRARLKYVLDAWGFEKFLQAVEVELGAPLRRVSSLTQVTPATEDRIAHIDFHPQLQSGKFYVGVVLPVGRLTSDQARGVADIARRYGSGQLRLTVWQNLIITDIDSKHREPVQQALRALGLDHRATNFRAGLVACTGSAGCKYAASNTKRHALEIASYLEERFELDCPINIHLTGCHHSCAQHYIGDIGLIGAKVEVGDDMVEGYDIFAGGGWGERQAIARLVTRGLRMDEVLPRIAAMISAYLDKRSERQAFHQFISGLSDKQLTNLGVAEVSI